jgi:hypothetical protein
MAADALRGHAAGGCPMDEIDVLHTAKLMLDQYGVEAEPQAALRVDKAFLAGDIELEQTWKRVVAAIRKLRNEEA